MFKKTWKNINNWGKLLIFFILIAFLLCFAEKHKKEAFTQKKKFVLKKNQNIYDHFYCDIYDDLVYTSVKNDFEVKEILRIAKSKKPLKILDVGSGTGHHVHLFSQKGHDVTGLDKSKTMIKKARKNYPKLSFELGDVEKTLSYDENTFDLITCLYFTIYYNKNKLLFLKNCYNWVKPNGYFILHLVNRDRFDPILPAADPLYMVSPQKYAKKRITNSLVKFNDFQYKADFKLKKQKDLAIFKETITDDASGHIRQNIHELYMPTQKHILSLAKSVGFILKGKVDMVSAQYEYQYLYILYKPE